MRDAGDLFLEGGDGLAVRVAHGDEDQCLEGQAGDAGVELGVVAGDRSGAFQGAQAAVARRDAEADPKALLLFRCSGAAMIAISALLLARHLLGAAGA